MPSTDRKLELQAKDINDSTVSQPAVCSNGLNKQSSGVQEWINPFYIYSYGENSFGLRTTFRNELSS